MWGRRGKDPKDLPGVHLQRSILSEYSTEEPVGQSRGTVLSGSSGVGVGDAQVRRDEENQVTLLYDLFVYGIYS